MVWATIAAAAIPALIGAAENRRNRNTSSTASGSGTRNERQSTNRTQQTNNLDRGIQRLIQQLAGTSAGRADIYSRENAIADTRGLVDSAIRGIREQTLPQITAEEASNGAYNSSMNGLLLNDATARAGEAVARQQLDAINAYGQLGNQGLGIAQNFLQSLFGATSTQVDNTTQELTSQTSGNSSGTGLGVGQGTPFADGIRDLITALNTPRPAGVNRPTTGTAGSYNPTVAPAPLQNPYADPGPLRR